MELKEQEISQLMINNQKDQVSQKLQIKRYEDEIDEIRKAMMELKQSHLRETEILKVKMATLHDADIKELVNLYETKLEGLTTQLTRSEEEESRIRAQLHEEIHKKFEMKKKYDMAISRLNTKILQLKTGMSSMENEMKDKLEN